MPSCRWDQGVNRRIQQPAPVERRPAFLQQLPPHTAGTAVAARLRQSAVYQRMARHQGLSGLRSLHRRQLAAPRRQERSPPHQARAVPLQRRHAHGGRHTALPAHFRSRTSDGPSLADSLCSKVKSSTCPTASRTGSRCSGHRPEEATPLVGTAQRLWQPPSANGISASNGHLSGVGLVGGTLLRALLRWNTR